LLASPNNACSNLTYDWLVNGATTGSISQVFSGNNFAAGDAISVILNYEDACGNSETANSNLITISAAPLVSAGSDVTINLGASIQLEGISSETGVYSWSPGEFLSNTSLLNPVATPTETTVFTLLVITPQGCTASDKMTLFVNDMLVDITNSFTPNGDGINDTWILPNIDLYPDFDLKIYNRWGNLLYEQNGLYTPWDGNYKGESLPSETYFYVLDLGNGLDAYKGTLTIVR
jgi:gliding motility-associated-like protein